MTEDQKDVARRRKDYKEGLEESKEPGKKGGLGLRGLQGWRGA